MYCTLFLLVQHLQQILNLDKFEKKYAGKKKRTENSRNMIDSAKQEVILGCPKSLADVPVKSLQGTGIPVECRQCLSRLAASSSFDVRIKLR